MARQGTAQTLQTGVAGSTAPDALSSLLETERELSEDIANAAEKARALADAARSAVRRMESAFDVEMAESVRVLEEAEEATTRGAIDAEAQAARDEVRRLTSVPDELVTMLADAVLRDFLGIAVIGEQELRLRASGDASAGGERGP